VINSDPSTIEWPDDDDELVYIPDDAKNLIQGLLQHDPLQRLGANGALEIKQHPFFMHLDWNNLLMIKADFIPQLDGPDDTSYFDTRSERYNHESNDNENNDKRRVNDHHTSAGSSPSSSAHSSASSSSSLSSDRVHLSSDEANRKQQSLTSSKSKKQHKHKKAAKKSQQQSHQQQQQHNEQQQQQQKKPEILEAPIQSIIDDNMEEEKLMDNLNSLCLDEYVTHARKKSAKQQTSYESNNELEDSELFASFSSCSSKFRFSRSNSNTNSPVLTPYQQQPLMPQANGISPLLNFGSMLQPAVDSPLGADKSTIDSESIAVESSKQTTENVGEIKTVVESAPNGSEAADQVKFSDILREDSSNNSKSSKMLTNSTNSNSNSYSSEVAEKKHRNVQVKTQESINDEARSLHSIQLLNTHTQLNNDGSMVNGSASIQPPSAPLSINNSMQKGLSQKSSSNLSSSHSFNFKSKAFLLLLLSN
jgi:hypothetical protein